MRLPSCFIFASLLVMSSACDTKPAEAKPAEAKPDAQEPTKTEPPVKEPPAELVDGVTPVADGSKGLEFELVSGDPSITVSLTPRDAEHDWMGTFSNQAEPKELDDLCTEGGGDFGIFSSVLTVTSTGYSKALASKVIVFEVGNTFDDTGHYEVGPAVLFWREGKPQCWTEHNTDGAERIATGLFEH